MLMPEGFPGQRIRVLPRPLVTRAMRQQPTARLMVTDAGQFPHAANHGRARRRGAPEAIVIFCVAGMGWCETDAQVLPVPTGSVLVLPPHQPHLYRADVADPWTIWWCHLVGGDLDALLDGIGRGTEHRVTEVHDRFRMVASFDQIVSALETDETMPNLITAAGAAWGLMAQIAADRISGVGRSEPVRLAKEYLRANFASQISLPELARLGGVSTSHFSALFRRSTGSGVTDYVKSLRMARARELLVTSDRNVAEIAHTVGYADAFYFSRQFSAMHSVSPTAYRRSFHTSD
ncbi:AraC family transcriptional regulator [Microlunatus soli]|uniref:AraC-type DNA-binding protein n=1 Tax=Microlunatus soli TaxID=630515 RepID=A0A1H1TEN6_9ACTN|nr:AraC family transcriptional regulator [Microlunatus soli]SDS58604.1 AraC-type DNA-binding protein [Microlunatus soli]